MTERKLFSLEFIDSSFIQLNLRSFDGDHPIRLEGISLTSSESNLHQHGWFHTILIIIFGLIVIIINSTVSY